MDPVRDTLAMIAGMRPMQREGVWVFVRCPPDRKEALLPQALAMFAEAEGPSLILPLSVAQGEGFDCSLPMACLTLQVHSALDGVGLTAAVAGVLAENGIPCNMVSGFAHDHAFVPLADAPRALALLERRALAAAADGDTKDRANPTDAP